MDLPAGYLLDWQAIFLLDTVKKTRLLEGEVVEIGSYLGRASVLIARQVNKLHCIDTWHFYEIPEMAETSIGITVDDYNNFIKNITNYNVDDKIHIIIGKSEDVFKIWKDNIKFIFIDGCHDYEYIKKDILWKKFIVDNGIMVIHDYPNWPGVKQAVDESMYTDTDFKYIGKNDNIIAFQKKIKMLEE